ncbi:MAG: YggS family pyridoxal phosphate-dependent enzyme [Azospirillum brasilense]|nr:MAG: YggS family pyridoxal phosphate-dependent enzyme [Azospirillum brasilense]
MSTPTTPPQPPVASALASLQQGVMAAQAPNLVPSAAPVIIGVSKGQPAARVMEGLTAGLTDIGENKVQEAQAKWPAVKAAYPAARLHLIGPLQSNKAADAVALFDVIQTVDRPKIIDVLAAEMAKQGRRPHLLVQVNTGEEPQKAGVVPQGLEALLRHAEAAGLRMDGLMCVPPAGVNPAPHFALLQKLARRHGLALLSMGMSSDYATAVRFGATHIRVGTALFGERG